MENKSLKKVLSLSLSVALSSGGFAGCLGYSVKATGPIGISEGLKIPEAPKAPSAPAPPPPPPGGIGMPDLRTSAGSRLKLKVTEKLNKTGGFTQKKDFNSEIRARIRARGQLEIDDLAVRKKEAVDKMVDRMLSEELEAFMNSEDMKKTIEEQLEAEVQARERRNEKEKVGKETKKTIREDIVKRLKAEERIKWQRDEDRVSEYKKRCSEEYDRNLKENGDSIEAKIRNTESRDKRIEEGKIKDAMDLAMRRKVVEIEERNIAKIQKEIDDAVEAERTRCEQKKKPFGKPEQSQIAVAIRKKYRDSFKKEIMKDAELVSKFRKEAEDKVKKEQKESDERARAQKGASEDARKIAEREEQERQREVERLRRELEEAKNMAKKQAEKAEVLQASNEELKAELEEAKDMVKKQVTALETVVEDAGESVSTVQIDVAKIEALKANSEELEVQLEKTASIVQQQAEEINVSKAHNESLQAKLVEVTKKEEQQRESLKDLETRNVQLSTSLSSSNRFSGYEAGVNTNNMASATGVNIAETGLISGEEYVPLKVNVSKNGNSASEQSARVLVQLPENERKNIQEAIRAINENIKVKNDSSRFEIEGSFGQDNSMFIGKNDLAKYGQNVRILFKRKNENTGEYVEIGTEEVGTGADLKITKLTGEMLIEIVPAA